MLISVIIPIYNAEKFLVRCLDSVLNQSFSDFELLLINDGSTDKSVEICSEYSNKDKRIKIVNQENNGPAAARNNGVQNATGEYIFFLDADDYIEPNALEVLHKNYSDDVDLVMGNFSKLEVDGETTEQSVSFNLTNEKFKEEIEFLDEIKMSEFIRHFLKYPSNHLISYCWARLYKASIIKDNKITANKEMHLFEDFVFNLEYLKYCKKTVFVNQSIYVYVMHNSHLSVSMEIVNGESLLHDMAIFRKKVLEYFQNKNKTEYNIEQEIGHALIHYVIIFFVRTGRFFTSKTKKKITTEFSKIISSSIYEESIKQYLPQKGNSRIIPFLTKFNHVYLTAIYCKWKGYKRYGKPVLK